MASDTVVREKVGRVGENQVHDTFRQAREDVQAIALKDPDAMFLIAEDRFGKGGSDVGCFDCGRRNFG